MVGFREVTQITGPNYEYTWAKFPKYEKSTPPKATNEKGRKKYEISPDAKSEYEKGRVANSQVRKKYEICGSPNSACEKK